MVLTAVLLFVVPLLLAEFTEVSPWLARKMVRAAARLLTDPSAVGRFAEEWESELEMIPGKLFKLGYAFFRLALLPLTLIEVRADAKERRVVEAAGQVPSPGFRNDEGFREFLECLEQDDRILRAIRIQNHLNGEASILLKDGTAWRISEAGWRELQRDWEVVPLQDHPEMDGVLFKRSASPED
jgi:hypothetical protein